MKFVHVVAAASLVSSGTLAACLAEPDFNRIAGFRLSTLTVGTPLNALPWRPPGLDLSQGGDSLFLALQGGTPRNPSGLDRFGILSLRRLHRRRSPAR